MSYTISVKVSNGSAVLATSGDLPDGEHIIHGTDSGGVVSIEVERRSELGRYVIRAGHHHDMHELAMAVSTPKVTDVQLPDDISRR